MAALRSGYVWPPHFGRRVDFRLARTSFRQEPFHHPTAVRVGLEISAVNGADGYARESSRGPTATVHREASGSMSEYEERFRNPLPSLGETFAASRVRKRSRWQRNRIRIVAAAVGVACAFASFDGSFRYNRATTVGEQISSTTVSDRVEAFSLNGGCK